MREWKNSTIKTKLNLLPDGAYHASKVEFTELTRPVVSRMTSSKSVRSFVKPVFPGSEASSSVTLIQCNGEIKDAVEIYFTCYLLVCDV